MMKLDTDIQMDVLEELRHDKRLAPNDIGVAVNDGIVSLFGEVDSLSKRSAATLAAGRIRGVRAVANDIVVRLPISALRTDTDVAHDAVHALMWDSDVPDKSIKIRVQDRWIWLIGEVDWQYQRRAAERAVERIRGVKGVTNLIRLKGRVPPIDVRVQLEATLRRNAQLADRTIRVNLRDGCIVLEGEVASWPERMAAEHVAWSARGVVDVENNLTVLAA